MLRQKTINKSLNIKALWPTLLALSLFLIPAVTFAQGSSASTDAIDESFKFFNVILSGIQAILWPILLLIGGLTNNDLLFSGGMATILLNIWSAVRDFVNILFVLGLLAVAIANIIGFTKDEYSIKKVLPMIVVALIAVNFSFLACKVILDAVNVTTTAIYAIPMASTSLQKYQNGKEVQILSNKICNKMFTVKDDQDKNPFCEVSASSGESSGTPATAVLSDAGKSFFSSFNSQNAALVMAVELMGVTQLDDVNNLQVKGIKTLTTQTLFSIIFLVIYASAFIALFCVLIVRVVVLWIAIATSPLSFLGIAFSTAKKSMGDDDPFFSLFMKHAFAPLKVAIVLTIGMIMITQLKQISPGAQYSTNPATLKALTSSASTLQDLIAGLACAAFVWIAAFKALSGTKAEPAVNWIKNAVGGVGRNLAKVPLYAPIIPTGKDGQKVSLHALAAGGGPLQQYINKREREDAKIMGGDKEKAAVELNQANTAEKAKKAIANVILASNKFRVDEDTQKLIAEKLEKFPQLKQSFVVFDRGTFLTALKSGNVNQAQMEEFYNKNKAQGFIAEGVDKNAATKVANEALTNVGGRTAGNAVIDTGMPALDQAATDLIKKRGELAKATSDAEVRRIGNEVAEMSKRVEELKAANNAVKGTDMSTIVDRQTGVITSAVVAKTIKGNFDAANLTRAGKAAARDVLIGKLARHLAGPGADPTDAQTDQAGKIIDDILTNGAGAKGLSQLLSH